MSRRTEAIRLLANLMLEYTATLNDLDIIRYEGTAQGFASRELAEFLTWMNRREYGN